MFASYRENLLISYKNFLFIVEIQLHTTIELIFFSPFDMMHWKTPSQALFLIPRGGWSVNKDRNIEHAYNTKRFTFNWHVYATSWFFFVLFFLPDFLHMSNSAMLYNNVKNNYYFADGPLVVRKVENIVKLELSYFLDYKDIRLILFVFTISYQLFRVEKFDILYKSWIMY